MARTISSKRDRAEPTVVFIPVQIPENERRWRVQQIVRILAEILRRNPPVDSSTPDDKAPRTGEA